MQQETPRYQRPQYDPRVRPKEMIAFDALEGKFTKFFHRFYPRLAVTAEHPKPYPWLIGGIHRLARQLDVAYEYELIFLFAAPFVVLFFLFWGHLGVPRILQGYGVIFTCGYFGMFLVDLVFLDRRLDQDDIRRLRSYGDAKRTARDKRMTERHAAKRSRPEVEAAANEALARGQAKASEAATATGTGAAPGAAKMALDQLLDPH